MHLRVVRFSLHTHRRKWSATCKATVQNQIPWAYMYTSSICYNHSSV